MWERYRSSHLTLKRRKTSKRLTKSWSFALMAPSNEKKRNSSLIKSQTFTLWSKHLKIQCFLGFFCRPCCCQLLYSEFLALHFESLSLVHFKLCGSWLNTFHVSPSQSVRLQWTEGPSSSALRSAQLCPILHLRSQVIEHYQFWQLPRATGIWVLPPFTQPAPPKHTHTHIHNHTHTHTHTHTHRRTHSPRLYCLSLERTRAGNERRNKSCQSKERNREVRISVGMLRTMRYFVPGFIIGLCLIWNRQLITLETTSPQHSSTAVSWKQSPHWNCLVGFLVQLLNSVQIVLDATE